MTEKNVQNAENNDSIENDSEAMDPEVLVRNIAKAMEDGSKLLTAILERGGDVKSQTGMADDVGHVGQLFATVTKSWMENPEGFAEAQAELMRGYADLFATMSERLNGVEVDPVVTPIPTTNASATRTGQTTSSSTSGSKPTCSPRNGRSRLLTRPTVSTITHATRRAFISRCCQARSRRRTFR